MAYKISSGIKEEDLSTWLQSALKKHGPYKDGGVDYTHADVAPIVMCMVVCGDEILLVRRGYGLADAEGYWSTINGFIDHDKPVVDIARQELEEEIGLKAGQQQIKVAKSYTLSNPKEKRKYIVFSCLVKVQKKPKVVLDREHTEFKWIKRDQLESYHILDDLPYAIDAALTLN